MGKSYLIFIILAFVAVVGYFVYDYIVTKKIMKDGEKRIMDMLSKVYDTAQVFLLGIFSFWDWDTDVDDDLIDNAKNKKQK
jgi:hypothetical protein